MSEQDEAATDRPRATRVNPDGEARKVWAEVYPGGDMMIEIGGMDCDEELYLMSDEPEALREVLNDLLGDSDE